MRIAALALFFGLIGAAVGEAGGFFAGAVFGVLLSMLLSDRTRIAKLEAEQVAARRELGQLKHDLAQLSAAPPQSIGPASQGFSAAPAVLPPTAAPSGGQPDAPVRIEIAPQPATPQAEVDAPAEELAAATGPNNGPADVPDVEAHASAREPNLEAAPAPAAQSIRPAAARPAVPDDAPQPFGKPLDGVEPWLRELLFGGNTIVRVGILVLLVGVVLLLRWAAEHAVFPIELRMAAAGLIAIALVAVGYRQRTQRPGFGRTLQGGGVAGLYLVVFFAYRTYELLPAGLAFGLLVCIALSSGILAVLQDALALVVIGQVGGFMAPVLASSGDGSHVALFSYYLLLNLLVFAVAWFKPWRALNLLGFAFTFGVGSSWGALRYRPEDFASTEPFLLAFFVLYSLIPVLYALRRRTGSGGWVDASLVFGTPLAVLLLQYAMVKDVRFGMAYSALGLAAFYVGLSRILYKRAREALERLIESFLAIGIGFATLAVPYGFDNHDFTGATWALEGAGLYWVGTRQQRWLSRLSGAALQLLAAGALLVQGGSTQGVLEGISLPEPDLALANARFLASLLLCLACLFVAHRAYRERAQLSRVESHGLQALIALGLFFYLFACFEEIHRHVAESLRPGVGLAATAASLFALSLVARKLAWLPGRFPAAIFALLLPLVLLHWESSFELHPLGRAGWLAFPICFALFVELLRNFVRELPLGARPLHCVFLWSCALFGGLEVMHLVSDFAGLNQTWSSAALAVVVALALAVTPRAALWPMREAPDTYVSLGGGVLAFMLVLWTWWANFSLAGDAAPLPYLPLLNPLDLAQLLVFGAFAIWARALLGAADAVELRSAIPALAGALAFLWFNALLARSVHHYAGVAFDPDALWDATPMQVSLSVSWSVLGLVGTVLASQKQQRTLWIVAASLLGVVVAKLFLIDLAQLSTIAKIATFLVVGLLLVLVGYFAPVPPAARTQKNEGKDA